MLHCGALILGLNRRGASSYAFRRSCIPEGSTTRTHLRVLSGKGVGAVAVSMLKQGDTVYAEQTTIICVVGENENYICKNCMVRVQKKVKVRADCNSLTYCSDQCLEAASDYLDICGPVIAKLQLVCDEAWKDTVQLLKLAINYLYALYNAASAHEVAMLLKVLDLESHPDTPAPVLQDAAAWLDASIGATFPNHVLATLLDRGITLQMASGAGLAASRTLYTLLRAIKYNAQPLPVHGIQKVQLLTLLPTVARVNHSCTPNCALMYSVTTYEPASTDQSGDNSNSINTAKSNTPTDAVLVCRYGISVSLVASRDIPADEELVVSYLQPLCSPVDLRQTLLKQAFQFDCRCGRCVADLSGSLTTVSLTPASKLEQQLMRLSSGGGSVAETQLKELLDLAEQLTSTATTLQSTVSTAHDAASYVLQQSLARLKYLATAPNKSNGVAEQIQNLTLALRASVVMSTCWVRIGCGDVLSRIELVVSGSNYAVQLQKMSNAAQTVASKGAASKSVQILREHLQDAVVILRTVYGCGNLSSDNGPGTSCTVNSMLNGEVQSLARDTSSGGYVKMLHAKATANLSTLY